MKFSFLFYEPIGTLEGLEHAMKALKALGYEGIELSACHPMPYPAKAIWELAARCGMPVVSLLSGWSYTYEGLCLSTADESVRRRAVERLCEYVELAYELGALVVVGLMQGVAADEPDSAKAGERIAACLREVAAVAVGRGVTVALEPVNHLQVAFHNNASEAAQLVARVDSVALGWMLDTLHMNIEERSVIDVIRVYGNRARHFHLCETHGGPLGTGGLDVSGVLEALRESGYGGYVSVKVYRGMEWERAAASAAGFLRALGWFPTSS
jgi:sugar phosphate isomerase/epimerase